MTHEKTLTVSCPTCNRNVPWLPEQQFKPFCCERCKMIDLGEWAMETRKIPGEPDNSYIDETDVNLFH
jgi:uncharacterized protein